MNARHCGTFSIRQGPAIEKHPVNSSNTLTRQDSNLFRAEDSGDGQLGDVGHTNAQSPGHPGLAKKGRWNRYHPASRRWRLRCVLAEVFQ